MILPPVMTTNGVETNRPVRSASVAWFACFALLLVTIQSTATAASDNFSKAVRQVLRDYVDVEPGDVGIVVGLVDEQGSRVIGYGISGSDNPEVDGDIVFEIGSITKTFTALLLQGMIERGEMKQDDPVAKHLPSSVKMPIHNRKEITLVHLATHTSGLPRDPDNLKPRSWANGLADYTTEDLYAFLAAHTLIRDPGVKYEYSNLGVGLLGHVIALKSGTNYESLVLNRICTPLGMESTRITLTPELKGRAAIGHDGFGKPTEDMVNPTLAGAGAIHSTVNDMLKYVSANLGLTESSLTALIQETHDTRLKNKNQDGAENQGLAWVSAGDLVWHAGGTSGFAAFAGFNKKQRRGIVVLSNSSAGRGVYSIVNLLMNSDWHPDKRPVFTYTKPSAPAPPPTFVKLNATALDAFAGRYQLASKQVFNITREQDHLILLPERRGGLELYPESETKLSCPLFQFEVAILKNERGQTIGVTTTCGERDFTGTALRISSRGTEAAFRKTTAWLLTGSGLLLLIAAVLVARRHREKSLRSCLR
jgi:serine-type D-Ala-D-Ala carboxypeptidase/endopeptidase